MDFTNEPITIVDESGAEKEVSLIFSYTDEETGREYMLFGDDGEDDVNVFVFYRDPDTPEDELEEIETDDVQKIADIILVVATIMSIVSGFEYYSYIKITSKKQKFQIPV